VAHSRGYLYWAWLDKKRPVLVISPDVRNERASDVLVVPVTTVLRPAPTHVTLRVGEGGVKQASLLKCEQVTTLHRDDVEGEPLGPSLSRARLDEVVRAVLRAIGVAVPLD
jgi:mRNA interferase MazF